MHVTVCKEVNVDIDITDIDDVDLLEELERRNLHGGKVELNMIADAFQLNQQNLALRLLEAYLYKATGRIIYLT